MAVQNVLDEMWAGNRRVQRFTITDEDQAGSPAKDLTGLTIKWALSRIGSGGEFNTTPIVEKTSDNPGEIDLVGPATDGIVDVTLVEADTLTLQGKFYFELEVFDATPEGVVVTTGELTINRNVVNT